MWAITTVVPMPRMLLSLRTERTISWLARRIAFSTRRAGAGRPASPPLGERNEAGMVGSLRGALPEMCLSIDSTARRVAARRGGGGGGGAGEGRPGVARPAPGKGGAPPPPGGGPAGARADLVGAVGKVRVALGGRGEAPPGVFVLPLGEEAPRPP